MARPIDADKALADIDKELESFYHYEGMKAKLNPPTVGEHIDSLYRLGDTLKRIIEDSITFDRAPGVWRVRRVDDEYEYTCSWCHQSLRSDRLMHPPRYCMYCGADMEAYK